MNVKQHKLASALDQPSCMCWVRTQPICPWGARGRGVHQCELGISESGENEGEGS